MQAWQQSVRDIASQLSSLTVTARLFVGAMAVALILALVVVAQLAAKPDLEPLGLSSNTSQEVRAAAVSYLQSRRIAYQEDGGDVLVPGDQKSMIWGELTEQEILSADQIDFDRLLQDDSPFRSRAQNSRRYLVAKMNEVARMLESWNSISRAEVVIDEPERPGGIGLSRVESTATVSVAARNGEVTQSLADAVARHVAGSHAGLKVANVTVSDAVTGRNWRARTDGDLASDQYLDLQQNTERQVQKRLEEYLGYITGVRIAVNAQVDSRKMQTVSSEYEEPKLGVTDERSRTVNSSSSRAPAEPGVRPNIGLSLAASGSGSSLSDEQSSTEAIPFVGTNTSQISDPKGHAIKINASVNVPESFMVALYRHRAGDEEADIDQAAYDALVQSELAEIRAAIEPLIDTTAIEGAIAGSVTVSTFHDVASSTTATVVPASSTGGGVAGGLLADGVIRYIGLGGLALLSLVMMLLMVRRAASREPLPTAEELMGIPPRLADTEDELLGDAEESEAVLDGVELDESQLRHQQMLDQINGLVDQSPDRAAAVLRRWIGAHA